jgi:hypothetical protein
VTAVVAVEVRREEAIEVMSLDLGCGHMMVWLSWKILCLKRVVTMVLWLKTRPGVAWFPKGVLRSLGIVSILESNVNCTKIWPNISTNRTRPQNADGFNND